MDCAGFGSKSTELGKTSIPCLVVFYGIFFSGFLLFLFFRLNFFKFIEIEKKRIRKSRRKKTHFFYNNGTRRFINSFAIINFGENHVIKMIIIVIL